MQTNLFYKINLSFSIFFKLIPRKHTWEKFTKQCADFKKQVQLTKYSNLAPPNQRSKARYHNIDVLVVEYG